MYFTTTKKLPAWMDPPMLRRKKATKDGGTTITVGGRAIIGDTLGIGETQIDELGHHLPPIHI
eukprot:5654350-Prorocentrum_lima.AAC.1